VLAELGSLQQFPHDESPVPVVAAPDEVRGSLADQALQDVMLAVDQVVPLGQLVVLVALGNL